MSTAPTPFATAIEQFVLETQRTEDKSSVFYREVLGKINSGHFHRDASNESRKWAAELAQYVDDLQQRNRKDSLLRKSIERLGPVVSGFNQYMGACDVLIQAGPAAAILLYGGVRVVLQLVQKVHDCYGAIVSMLEGVRKNIQILDSFSAGYETSDEVKEHLVESYKLIITFWLKASHLLSSKSPKAIFSRNSLLSRAWQSYGTELEKCSHTVSLAAQAAEAKHQRQRELESEARYSEEERKKSIRSVADWIRAGEDNAKLDFRTLVREKAAKRHGRSCEWAVIHPSLQKWLRVDKSSSIWLYGLPGTGKSVLTSHILQYLEAQEVNGKRLQTISYYFLFDDPRRRKVITALDQSLYNCWQYLVQHLHSADVAQHVNILEDLDCLAKVVAALTKHVSRVHIVVDGLDECEDRELLLRLLKQISVAPTYGTVKWLFTSRAEEESETSLNSYVTNHIELSADNTHNDVRSFMTEKLRAEPCSKCDHCTDLCISKAEGNFLWADTTLRIMAGEGFTCEREVEEALSRFPTGLQGCYARSLQHLVRSRTKAEVELARKVFILVAGARQPLRLSEVEHALIALRNVELSKLIPVSDYDEKWKPRSGVISRLCSGLIVFEQLQTGLSDDPLLKFSHKSVYDFFHQDVGDLEIPAEIKTFFVWKESANLLLAETCLRYLSFARYERSQDVRSMIVDDSHAFLAHAAAFWYDYWRQIPWPPEKLQVERVVHFIKSPCFWNCVTTQAHVVPHLYARLLQSGHSSFRLQASQNGSFDDPKKVHYSSPLPSWLDDKQYGLDGPHVVEAFQAFIKQWHPVLNSNPSAIKQCIMSHEWYVNFPSRKRWRSKRVRIWELPYAPGSKQSLAHMPGRYIGNVALQSQSTDKFCDRFHSSAIRDTDLLLHGRPQSPLDTIHVLKQSLSYEDCRIEVYDDRVSSAVLAAFKKSLPPPAVAYSSNWNLIRYSDVACPAGSRTLTATFCTSDSPVKTPTDHSLVVDELESDIDEDSDDTLESGTDSDGSSEREENSSSGSESSEDHRKTFDSENVSDAGSTNQTSVDDHAELNAAITREPNRCGFIATSDNPPVYSLWASTSVFEEVHVGYSRNRQVAIWSQRPSEASIVDLAADMPVPITVYLPEPKILTGGANLKAVRKEFHLSEEGAEVYYLAVCTKESAFGIEKSLSITALTLEWSEGGPSLDYAGQICKVTHRAAGAFRSPSIMTASTSDCLYAVLPQPSCDPKVVRLRLSDVVNTTEPGFETLKEPVYFPASTVDRNSKIYVFDRDNDKQSLVLTLDAECSPDGKAVLQEPLVMEWTLDRKSDWRLWDEALDAESEQYKTATDDYGRLRGTFVDANQRFNVPIRSGLDWTRKTFVSCG